MINLISDEDYNSQRNYLKQQIDKYEPYPELFANIIDAVPNEWLYQVKVKELVIELKKNFYIFRYNPPQFYHDPFKAKILNPDRIEEFIQQFYQLDSDWPLIDLKQFFIERN